MGKVEDLRKMREARYEAMKKRRVDPSLVLPVAMDVVDVKSDACGYKGVGGKTCTRLKNHPEKNHRYR